MKRVTVSRIVALTGCLIAFACGSSRESGPLVGPNDSGSCGPHAFLYDDVSCDAPGATLPDGGRLPLHCQQEGDRLCHPRCSTDAECTDPSRPYCRLLGLWDAYDSNCNTGVRICREKPIDDCGGSVPALR